MVRGESNTLPEPSPEVPGLPAAVPQELSLEAEHPEASQLDMPQTAEAAADDPAVQALAAKAARAGKRIGSMIMLLHGMEWRTAEDLGASLYPGDPKYAARYKVHGTLSNLRKRERELLHPAFELQANKTGNPPGFKGPRDRYRIVASGTPNDDKVVMRPTDAQRIIDMLKQTPHMTIRELVEALYQHVQADPYELHAQIVGVRNHIAGARRLLRDEGLGRVVVRDKDGYRLSQAPDMSDMYEI